MFSRHLIFRGIELRLRISTSHVPPFVPFFLIPLILTLPLHIPPTILAAQVAIFEMVQKHKENLVNFICKAHNISKSELMSEHRCICPGVTMTRLPSGSVNLKCH